MNIISPVQFGLSSDKRRLTDAEKEQYNVMVM